MVENSGSPTPRVREHNPRWKGYVYIMLCSLVHFASVANIESAQEYQGMWEVTLLFGLVTCSLSVLILLFDRFQCCQDKFNYTMACGGNLEGYTLILFCLWWIVGVAYTTQVDGLAYLANNIYFSCWASLIACVYTLNQWSSEKDILSIKELTGVSETLPSWYVLAISSLVVAGTSVDLYTKVADIHKDFTSYAIIVGLVSSAIAWFFIFVHYKFIDFDFVQDGGWLELCASFFMILLWTICTAVFTQDAGIAATISGAGCRDRKVQIDTGIDFGKGCYVVYRSPYQQSTDDQDDLAFPTLTNETPSDVSISCSSLLERQIPGSNLYLSCWICFFASINVTLRWTAAQAMQFAHAQNRKVEEAVRVNEEDVDDDDSDDSLSDDDDDDI